MSGGAGQHGGSGPLQGKVALVTGAGSGIGAGVARRLADEGAHVVVAEVEQEAGQALATEIGGHYVATDVRDRAQVIAAVQAAVDTYGSIHVLVNNAWSGGQLSRAERKSDEELRSGWEIGFLAPFWAMQAALPHLRRQRWGRIINMVSLNGVNAHVGSLDYNAAKEALRALTRTTAREWAGFGVTVNAVAPAAKSRALLQVLGDNEELAALADAMNPMGRIGDPYADIAPVVTFLASEGAGYLTGNTLFVDGGSHINGVAWAPDLED